MGSLFCQRGFLERGDAGDHTAPLNPHQLSWQCGKLTDCFSHALGSRAGGLVSASAGGEGGPMGCDQ